MLEMLLKNKLHIWVQIISVLLIANYFLWQAVAFAYDNKLYIYFFDVGQGDSILIRTPNNKNILIDGGPNSSVLPQLFKVLPIWNRQIDLMVLTHPQADHVTGLLEVLNRFKVKEILATFAEYPTKTNQEWLTKVSNHDCILNWADASDDYYFGEVYWDTLWPIDLNFTSSDINEDSVTARISYGDFSILLTGDIGFLTESKLLDIYSDINSTVLKVGHHGSRYASSEEFLFAVKPEVAVITVGRNSHGHPAADTLNRLDDIGADIYRTDMDGLIEIIIDNDNYFIKPH